MTDTVVLSDKEKAVVEAAKNALSQHEQLTPEERERVEDVLRLTQIKEQEEEDKNQTKLPGIVAPNPPVSPTVAAYQKNLAKLFPIKSKFSAAITSLVMASLSVRGSK